MERLSRPSMTSMSLARFSLKYTTYFLMGIYVYGGIYSRSSTLARRDSIQFPYASLQDAVRVEYRQETYSVTIVTSVP